MHHSSPLLNIQTSFHLSNEDQLRQLVDQACRGCITH